jgi:hypothetical protein
MEDRFTKYSKLYFLVAGVFLAVPVVLALVIGFFYGFFKIFSSRPLDIIYELLIVAMPASIFCTVYYIFIGRTKKYPSAGIKIVSQVLFMLAFCTCLVVLTMDIIHYFKLGYNAYEIKDYKSFSQLFMAGNIALMFIVALVQAFGTPKEEDWIARRKKREGGGD